MASDHTRTDRHRMILWWRIFFEKPSQKGGSRAPSLGLESKYAKDLDDPKKIGAIFKEKGQKVTWRGQFLKFWIFGKRRILEIYQGSHVPNFQALGIPISKRRTRTQMTASYFKVSRISKDFTISVFFRPIMQREYCRIQEPAWLIWLISQKVYQTR